MKENLKVNILWLLLLLAGYGLISVLVSVGVLNLFYVQILQQIGINIILAVGLNLIVGFSGQFSLGHAGFMAIGAYAAAIIGSKSPTYGAFFGAMLIGALLSGAVALLVGIPTLRLKGDYLAVATLGVSEISVSLSSMAEALQMVRQVSWEFLTLQLGKWYTSLS